MEVESTTSVLSCLRPHISVTVVLSDSLCRTRSALVLIHRTFIKSRTGMTIPLLDHRLRSTKRVSEGAVVFRVAALVLVDFPLDLFGRVLVIVLLISGHRLRETRRSKTVGSKENSWALKIPKECSFVLGWVRQSWFFNVTSSMERLTSICHGGGIWHTPFTHIQKMLSDFNTLVLIKSKLTFSLTC